MKGSLIAFPFYKMEFGWGMPTRMSFATSPYNKWFFLMDNLSAVGAISMLDEQDIPIFEPDPQFLEFAIPLPNQ